jgi:hypothetical protein
MSIRTLVIWSIIAGLLGGGALILRSQQASSVRDQPVEWTSLQFDPASIVSMSFGPPDLEVQIERSPDRIDEWVGTWSTDAGDQRWGVSSTRVRAALRTLATSRVRLSEDQLVESGSGIELQSRDGSSIRLTAGPDRAGGRAPIRLEQRDESGAIARVLDGWVESGFFEAFTFEKALAWRDPRLFDLALPSVSAVDVRAGEFRTRAELVGARWMITAPYTIHADRDSIESLLRTMITMEAAGFEEGPTDDSTTGLSTPIAVIGIQTSNAGYSLELGQQADLSGETLYARFSREQQSTLLRLPISSLTKLTAYPDAYIASIAYPGARTSISGVRVLGREGRVRFEAARDQGSWLSRGTTLDTLTSDSISRLLSVFTQANARATRVIGPETELPRVIAGVELVDSAGEELGSYQIALEQTQDGISLLVAQALGDDQRVVWAYVGDEAQATATWLTLSAGRPTESN